MVDAALTYVQRGTVLIGAEPFNVHNLNDTYRGQILLADGQVVSAIIKDLDCRQLANELMAAAMGVASGLPIPTPIIAKVELGTLGVSRYPLEDNTGHLVFASADMNIPNVQQIFFGDPSGQALIREKLVNWSDVGGMYGFDSWIANIDRHPGNLLFSGKNEVWLIDHGHSFTGPDWSADQFLPDGQYNNKLAQWLTPFMAEGRRKEVAGAASVLPARLNGMLLEKLGEENYVAGLLVRSDFDALITFLNERVTYVPRLASNALGILI